MQPGLEQQHPREVALGRRGAGRCRAIDDREQHAGEHDEEQRDAVDAEVPGDAPRLDPRVLARRTGSRRRASCRRRRAPTTLSAAGEHAGEQRRPSLTQLGAAVRQQARRRTAPDRRAARATSIGEDRGSEHHRFPRTTTNQASSSTTPTPIAERVVADVAASARVRIRWPVPRTSRPTPLTAPSMTCASNHGDGVERLATRAAHERG